MAVTFLTDEDAQDFVRSVNGKTPGENGNVEIPTDGGTAKVPYFDLTEMGLPEIPLDGTPVGMECDTAELLSAAQKGPVFVGIETMGMYNKLLFNGINREDGVAQLYGTMSIVYVDGTSEAYAVSVNISDGYLTVLAIPLVTGGNIVRLLNLSLGNSPDDIIDIFSGGPSITEDGETRGVLCLGYDELRGTVILRGIGDGERKTDAATVGQMDKALKSTVKSVNEQTPDENGNVTIQTNMGKVITVNGDKASDKGAQICSFVNSGYAVALKVDGLTVPFTYGTGTIACFSRLNASGGFQEWAVDEVGNIRTSTFSLVKQSAFDSAIGDILNSLDAIIAMQEELIGGESA